MPCSNQIEPPATNNRWWKIKNRSSKKLTSQNDLISPSLHIARNLRRHLIHHFFHPWTLLMYASSLEWTLTICYARRLCHWGKGHVPSKLKMNWMSPGCQCIINNHLVSLMIISLPEDWCNLGLGHRCSGIDVLYKPSLSEPRPTRDMKSLLIRLYWDKCREEEWSEEVVEYKRHWKTPCDFNLVPRLLFLIPPF